MMGQRQFSIPTERLLLVPLQKRHAKELLPLWGDAEVVRYMNLSQFKREGQCRARIKALLAANIKKGCANHFVLMLGETVIGLAGFPLDHEEIPSFGLYYLLQKEHWGRGYAAEAADAILAYLFDHYPNAIVYADSVADNRASVAILQKLGFEETRREEGAFTKNGGAQDILHFRRKAEGI